MVEELNEIAEVADTIERFERARDWLMQYFDAAPDDLYERAITIRQKAFREGLKAGLFN